MKPKDFVQAYKGHALQTQQKTGISAIAILAQAALESGWGEAAPGNMFFGVKDTDGINGNEQLITTTEFSSRANLKFPVILSVTPVVKGGRKMFMYKVKDYFRKYNSPEESFTDHATFFQRNPRYKKALEVAALPYSFITEVAKAGYATAPDYALAVAKVANTIQQYM